MAAVSNLITPHHVEPISTSIFHLKASCYLEKWTLKQVQGDEGLFALLRRLPI
jgi:hypothetical protein